MAHRFQVTGRKEGSFFVRRKGSPSQVVVGRVNEQRFMTVCDVRHKEGSPKDTKRTFNVALHDEETTSELEGMYSATTTMFQQYMDEELGDLVDQAQEEKDATERTKYVQKGAPDCESWSFKVSTSMTKIMREDQDPQLATVRVNQIDLDDVVTARFLLSGFWYNPKQHEYGPLYETADAFFYSPIAQERMKKKISLKRTATEADNTTEKDGEKEENKKKKQKEDLKDLA